jgi:hypothetical protein
MVPVRDSSFIGKKIDCPKCKYRFVVEEPEVEEDDRDEAPARGDRDGKKGSNGKAAPAKKGKGRRDEDEGAPGKKKKKTGPSTTLIVGVGLGAVGVVVLVIGALWMFGVIGGDDTPVSSNTNTPSGPPAGGNTPRKQDETPAEKAPAGYAGKDPTNLLLNDSSIVLRLNLSNATGSGVSRAAFEAPGAFSPTAFKQHFGFGVGEVETALRAINILNATHFNVIRTKNELRKDDLSQRLGLKPEEPIQGMPYYTITSDLDSFGNFLFQEEPKNRKDRLSPLALHYADDRTLVIGHLPAMKSFLEAKGAPANLTQPPPASSQGGNRGGGPPGGGMMGMMGGPGQGGGGPPGGMMGGPGQGGGGPPGGMMGGPGQGGGGPPGGMMGGPGQGGGGPPAGGGPAAGGGPPAGGQRGGRGGPGQDGPAAGGAGGQQGGGGAGGRGGGRLGGPGGEDVAGAGGGGPPGGMMGGAGMMGGPGGGMMGGPGGMMGGPGARDNTPASSSYLTILPRLKAVMDAVEVGKETTLLSLCFDKEAQQGMFGFHDSMIDLLPTPLDLRNRETSALAMSIQALRPNRLTFMFAQYIKNPEDARSLNQTTTLSDLERQAAIILKLRYNIDAQLGSQQRGGMGGGGNPGAGMMGGGPGMMGGGPGMMGGGPGMMGGGPGMMGGGPGMMGGGPGMMGAGGGGAQPPGGAGGTAGGPGAGMMGGGPGMMGGGPGMMGGQPGPGMRGGQGGGGGRPGQGGGQQQQQDVSTVTVALKDQALSLRVDVILSDSIYEQIRADLQTKISLIKGEAEMIGAKSKVHELAAALSQLVKKRGKFPMGARERRTGPDRLGVAYSPDQRISWLAELLPYLGAGEYSELYDAIAWEKSWRDSENQVVATSLVSHFLNPWSSRPTWWVPYANAGAPVAATHFVGIAGLGLDAAEYSRDDKSVADKIGVFHYDWQTDLKDVKKPEATIAILQVPYEEFKTPWLAGGGSTVRGVAEDTGLDPFVCESFTHKDGTVKAGTYAIMANGDVRFIPRDIPKDVFLKMCSINLADKLDNLDDYVPLVPAPKVAPKVVLPPVTPEKKSSPEKRDPESPKTAPGGGSSSKALSAISTHCAQCHTGARSKGKNIMFNDDGSLSPNINKDAIAKAIAEGKMPPKGRPRPSDDDTAAIQAWLKGG